MPDDFMPKDFVPNDFDLQDALDFFASRQTLDTTLGITYDEATGERVVASLRVTPAVHQPAGLLHGGASVVLAESVASVGATLSVLPEKMAVGLEINANHVRSVRSGVIRAVGEPLHQGRATQVWRIEIRDEKQRLVCVSRCTLALIDAQLSGGGTGREAEGNGG